MSQRGAFFAGVFFLLVFAGTVDAADNDRTIVFGCGNILPSRGGKQVLMPTEAYEVELIDIVAKAAHLKYRIEYKSTWAEVEAGFARGEIDAIPTVARRPEREVKYLFTTAHTRSLLGVFAVEGGDQPRSEDDLSERRLLVVKDSVAHLFAQSQPWGKHLIVRTSETDAIAALIAGEGDAWLEVQVLGTLLLKNLNLGRRVVLTQTLKKPVFEYAMALHPRDDALQAQLNEGLLLAKNNGSLDKLYERWSELFEPAWFIRYRLELAAGLALLGLAGFGWVWREQRRS